MRGVLGNFLKGVGITGAVALVFGLIILGVIDTNKKEKAFKAECIAVAGRVVYDDNELECHKNGFEIAEFRENSPHNPVWNDRVN
jgi:hypothetical protein